MSFAAHLRDRSALLCVELRPPRADLARSATIDSWFDMNATLRRVATPGRVVFLTDNAAGSPEEESLHHLVANLEEAVPRDLICPLLTTKHELEYCQWFAARAVQARFPALVVLGGDRHVGPPRCLPHGADLRRRVRARHPDLSLGGWANPHADPVRQVDLLLDPAFAAEFFLTQVVSHYDLDPVRRFREEALRRRVPAPGVVGVFFYRSANPATLATLAGLFPVPIEGLTRDFEAGVPPEEICARSIRALRELGVRHVYVSNLPTRRAPEVLADIESRLE